MPATKSLTPADPSYWSMVYGGIPSVPDPLSAAATAISGARGNLGDLYKLATGAGAASAAGARAQVLASFPGYDEAMTTWTTGLVPRLAGQISPYTLNLLERYAAERGTRIGSPGSANELASLYGLLGKTSEGIQSEALKELTTGMAAIPKGPEFDPSKYLTTPSDVYTSQLLANILRSAPVPYSAGAANLQATMAGLGAGGRAGSSPYIGWTPGNPLTPLFPFPTGGVQPTPDTGGDRPAGFPWMPTSGVPSKDVTPTAFPAGESDFFTAGERGGFEDLASAGISYDPFAPAGSYNMATDTTPGYAGADEWSGLMEDFPELFY